MIIDRAVAHHVVRTDATVGEALERIGALKSGLVFCVDADGTLQGSLSDGDVRRWLLAHTGVDLTASVAAAMNPAPVAERGDAHEDDVRALLVGPITRVPLVDDCGRVVAIAIRGGPAIKIGDREIDERTPALVIAEVGINHNGDMGLASKLIDAAVAAGADAVKFQMRDLASLYRSGRAASVLGEDAGAQYAASLLHRFTLPPDDLFRLFDRCTHRGAIPLCSPWDEPSLEALQRYGIDAVKIASADLTNHQLLRQAADLDVPVLLSTGMSTELEVIEAVDLLRSRHAAYALLHCVSSYPAPYKDVNLPYLQRLASLGSCVVGYSGHERGYEVAIAAVALGARIIEKHVTLDRALEGNDHKISLLPSELAAMVRAVRNVEEALRPAAKRVTPGEMLNRVALAKSLVAREAIPSGTTLDETMLVARGPGRGLQPNRLRDLVGRRVLRTIPRGAFVTDADLVDVAPPRTYRFRRPWGIPVRFHDAHALAERVRPGFLEFHLTDQDMREPVPPLAGLPNERVVVHSPDLFGDTLLDLAAVSSAARTASRDHLQSVIDVAWQIADAIGTSRPPVVVASLGGVSFEAPYEPDARAAGYDRIAAGLASLDAGNATLLAQTLPPFPWYRGGQLFCNLFVDPRDTSRFCEQSQTRLCLDTAHTKLAANHLGYPFEEAVDLLAPHSSHLHLVDAAG
ncbi:MAG: N-acetylneuraminate synthase family protein, partial [Acidimicrobiales bacterium]